MDIAGSRVLIVDDSYQNIQLLASLLQGEGYKVAVATSGDDAIHFVETEATDLVLLDIMMPGTNGFEVLEHIRSLDGDAEIPVIVVSALSSKEEKIRMFKQGAVDYIVKPFVREEVLARVRVHLKLHHAYTRIKELALKDKLTGAYNRWLLFEMYEKIAHQSYRSSRPFTLCYLDIDSLKEINDTYGHGLGDSVIKAVADSVLKNIRNSDYFFRTGGDEFLIIFADESQEQTEQVIKRIKENLKLDNGGDFISDFSYGLKEVQPGEGIGVEAVLPIIDQRMYRDKFQKKKNGI